MLQHKVRNTNIGIGVGIILQIAGTVLQRVSPDDAPLVVVGFVLILIAAVLIVWGCCNYAQGKGYPWPVGFLGLLSLCGLIIMVLLPDKHPQGR